MIDVTFLAWGLFVQRADFQFFVGFFGKEYLVADNRVTFAMIVLAWSFKVALMLAFLLQKKTKEIFLAKNSLALQSGVSGPLLMGLVTFMNEVACIGNRSSTRLHIYIKTKTICKLTN